MSQGNLILPTVSPVTGLTMTTDTNAALLALATANSGASAPTNATGAAPIAAQFWGDTSVAGQITLNQYSGSAWVVIGVLDITNGYWTPPLSGGVATTIASATTTDLGSKANAYVTVSGVTTITGFGSSAVVGTIKVVRFSGILLLTYNATSMILPTAANITTAAGDIGWFAYEGSGNWRCLSYQLASGAPLSTTAVGAQQLITSAQGMNAPLNLKILATVSGNALTVAIKGTNGSDASASNPVLIPFRDATLTTGDVVIGSLQAALAFTTPTSGNTFGSSSSNVPFRLWVIAYYNGGTIAVGVFNASTASQIFGLPEGNLVTTAASTNGGSSAGVYYANVSAITNTPFRILGYLDWASGLTTAGTWASGPTTIQLFGPGIKKPGDVVQTVYVTTTTTTAVSSTTNTVTALTGAITPTSAANLMRIDAKGFAGGNGGGGGGLFQLYRNGSTAIGNITSSRTAGGVQVANFAFDAPGTTSSTTYALYLKLISGTTTWTFLATTADTGALVPGTNSGVMTIDEIMG